MTLLDVENAVVSYAVAGGRRLRAVDGVSLTVAEGESVGVVGESGSGKTSLANAIVGLVPLEGGSVHVRGRAVRALRGRRPEWLCRAAQMVFQDPFGSLNPRLSVGSALCEVLSVHGIGRDRAERRERVERLLTAVGLSGGDAGRYVHEFSGGQRQRIGIARALALEPKLIIADEPVSALDVSVQVQILNLLRDLQAATGVSYLFIAHDLAVVRYVCRRVLVMYLGRVVESGPVETVLRAPAHPYTEALISAVPDVEEGLRARRGGRARIVPKGDAPSPAAVPSGCPYHPRCHRARSVCAERTPPRWAVGEAHWSVCHFAGDVVRETSSRWPSLPAAPAS